MDADQEKKTTQIEAQVAAAHVSSQDYQGPVVFALRVEEVPVVDVAELDHPDRPHPLLGSAILQRERERV